MKMSEIVPRPTAAYPMRFTDWAGSAVAARAMAESCVKLRRLREVGMRTTVLRRFSSLNVAKAGGRENALINSKMQAAGRSLPLSPQGVRWGRKVRTPQGSVPDNVRGPGVKARLRPVQQKANRLRLLGDSPSGTHVRGLR